MKTRHTTNNPTKFPYPNDWPDLKDIFEFIQLVCPSTTYSLLDDDKPPGLRQPQSHSITFSHAQLVDDQITWPQNRDLHVALYFRDEVSKHPTFVFLHKQGGIVAAWDSFNRVKPRNSSESLFDHPCAELTFYYAIAQGMLEYLSIKERAPTSKDFIKAKKHLRALIKIVKNCDLLSGVDKNNEFLESLIELDCGIEIASSTKIKRRPRMSGANEWGRAYRQPIALHKVALHFYERFGESLPTALSHIAPIFENYYPARETISSLVTEAKQECDDIAHKTFHRSKKLRGVFGARLPGFH